MAELAALPWRYTTRTFAALSWRFCVRVSNPTLGALIDDVLSGLVTSARPDHVYSLIDCASGSGRRGVLYVGDRRVKWTREEPMLLETLLWHVNQSVIATSDAWVLLHAAAVEQAGRAVILSAPMESGKTTTAAGLVGAGMRYLTDEAVALDPATLEITPFAKPLSVDRGSWDVLSELRPEVAPSISGYLRRQWPVPALRINGLEPTVGAVPALVVLPRYQRGGPTRLTPVSRAQTLKALLDQSFTFARHPRRDFASCAALVARVSCYQLTIGDLDEAVELIQTALAADRERAARGRLHVPSPTS